MRSEFVTTRDGQLLSRVRDTLVDADRVLICVAFAVEQGVHLLRKELMQLRDRRAPVELVATTSFGMSSPAALQELDELGVKVRTYSPSRGTFHPKVYLGLHGDGRARAVVGSANLTGGLSTNVEAGMYLEGTLRDRPLEDVRLWALERLGDPIVEYWVRPERPVRSEEIATDLLPLIKAAKAVNPFFMTLGKSPQRNEVTAVTPTAVWVTTKRSEAPQCVPAKMLNLAWDYLKAHGMLWNTYLLNDLRVHRSSFVCALLARLPGVEPIRGAKIGVRLRGR